MLGQLWVEPELELFGLDPDELEPDELDEPELVLLDPELELVELDDGVVVDELVLALDPVVPVFELVVAALATSAPPVTRPVVRVPIATTCRNRTFMVDVLSFREMRRPVRSGSHTLRPGSVAGRTTTATYWLRFLTIG
jgi:hypothetical protein